MRVRVLHVINQMWRSGAETSLRQLLLTMDDDAVEHQLLSLSHDRNATDDLVAAGIPCGAPRAPLQGRAAAVRFVARAVRDRAPDLLHTTLYDADLAGRVAALGARVPVLTSIVNSQYSREAVGRSRSPAKLRVAQALDGLLARHATAYFHAITHAVADEASAALGVQRDRFRVVPRGRSRDGLGGAPTASRRARVRAALGLSDDDRMLLTVGRQEPQKGQVHLLDALPTVLARHADARLLVAGREGNSSEVLRRTLATSPAAGRITFLGQRSDVGDLLCAADLFVFPSLWEGLGGAVIEAMAMGVPVVASDLPAVREVLADGSCGLLVPPGDPGALAAAVSSLLDEPGTAAALADRATRRYESTYTLERSARGMERLYREIAAAEGLV